MPIITILPDGSYEDDHDPTPPAPAGPELAEIRYLPELQIVPVTPTPAYQPPPMAPGADPHPLPFGRRQPPRIGEA